MNKRRQAVRFLFAAAVVGSGIACGGTPSVGSTTPTLPTLTGLAPVSGPVGTAVTLTGTGFAPTGNLVFFGRSGGVVAPTLLSAADGRTLSLVVPRVAVPPCQVLRAPGQACPQFVEEIQPGTNTVAVMTPDGTSNSLNFSVTAPHQ
jgi:hypothetical protein